MSPFGLIKHRKSRTYIRVVADLLDHRLVEVTGIALEAIKVVRVLGAGESINNGRAEVSLSKLKTILLTTIVNFLDPSVMLISLGVVNVLLELDNVRIGNDVGVNRAKQRSRSLVNGLGAERCLGNSHDRKS